MVATRTTLAMVFCVLPRLVCAGQPAEHSCDADGGQDTCAKPLGQSGQSILQKSGVARASSLGVTEEDGETKSAIGALPCTEWWMWRSGDGTGGHDIKLKDGVDKRECQRLCEEKRREDKNFNGCTWSKSKQSCWAESGMTGTKHSWGDWITSWLPCNKVIVGDVSPSLCKPGATWYWVNGLGDGHHFYYHFDDGSMEDCQKQCERYRKYEPRVNGCVWKRKTGRCWAHRHMVWTNTSNTGYMTSFIPSPIPCKQVPIEETRRRGFTSGVYTSWWQFSQGAWRAAQLAYGRDLCWGKENPYHVTLKKKETGLTFSGYIYFQKVTLYHHHIRLNTWCLSEDSPICANAEKGDSFAFDGDGSVCRK